MKKTHTLILTLMLYCITANSQDIIFKKNGDEIKAKVLEVSAIEVKYKRFESQQAATYVLDKSEIFMVKYEDGSKDIFNSDQVTNTVITANSSGSNEPVSENTIRAFKICNKANSLFEDGRHLAAIEKYQEAIKIEQDNALIYFNYGTALMGLDKKKFKYNGNKDSFLLYTAEDAFKKMTRLEPNNAIYNYAFGALYFNYATTINDEMNVLSDTSRIGNAYYDFLKIKRDAYFEKSVRYLEKSMKIFQLRESSLSPSEQKTFANSIQGLINAYARVGRVEDAFNLKAKYKDLF